MSQATSWSGPTATRVALFVAAHVPLAFLVANSTVATIHALVTLAVSLGLALRHRRIELAVYAAAYIAGAEVLWRMNAASVFWEVGKYGVVLVLVIAGLRLRSRTTWGVPLVYFALLLPSIAALSTESFRQFRGNISFNLSGPLSLAAAAWFFAKVSLNRDDLRKIAFAIIAPVTSIATLAFVASSRAEVDFGHGSNVAASGGFGPNQVSAMLGLGLVSALFLAADKVLPLLLRAGAGLAVVVFAMQSALTFSRGGLYGAAATLLAAVVLTSTSPRVVLRWVAVAGMLAVVAEVVIVPRLETQTHGAIAERFNDTNVTGRDRMMNAELEVFRESPLLGSGPGGMLDRRLEGRSLAAHTEFTRLIGEHGVFGLASMLLLFSMAFTAVRGASPGAHRALAASCIIWAFTFMMHASMRLAAPGLMFGLGMAGLSIERARARARVDVTPPGTMVGSPVS